MVNGWLLAEPPTTPGNLRWWTKIQGLKPIDFRESDQGLTYLGTLPAPRGTPIPAFRSALQWAVAPDGRVAVVHPEPYRVDSVDPFGQLQIGAVIPLIESRCRTS